MEYCAGRDLAHLLRRVKRLPEAAAQHLMRQLAGGLRQMWAHHLVHVSAAGVVYSGWLWLDSVILLAAAGLRQMWAHHLVHASATAAAAAWVHAQRE